MAGVDLLSYLLLNILRDDEVLRFAVRHKVIWIAWNEQHRMRYRTNHAVGNHIRLRRDFPTIINATRGRYVPIRASPSYYYSELSGVIVPFSEMNARGLSNA
jgi:hypothetical protein